MWKQEKKNLNTTSAQPDYWLPLSSSLALSPDWTTNAFPHSAKSHLFSCVKERRGRHGGSHVATATLVGWLTCCCLRSVYCRPWGVTPSFDLEKSMDGELAYTRLSSKSIRHTFLQTHNGATIELRMGLDWVEHVCAHPTPGTSLEPYAIAVTGELLRS